MANVLNTDKQIDVFAALAKGSSIRAVKRMKGVHRDTLMRLGIRIGEGCIPLLDAKMRNLPCNRLDIDEVWGFIGKKESRLKPGGYLDPVAHPRSYATHESLGCGSAAIGFHLERGTTWFQH